MVGEIADLILHDRLAREKSSQLTAISQRGAQSSDAMAAAALRLTRPDTNWHCPSNARASAAKPPPALASACAASSSAAGVARAAPDLPSDTSPDVLWIRPRDRCPGLANTSAGK